MKQGHPVTFFRGFRRAPRRARAAVAILLSLVTGSAGLQAQGPAGGVVRAGDAKITGEGTASTRIEQFSDRAIIDWRSFGVGAADQVIFQQPSAQAATLNRVTGDQVSVILGRLDANGHVFLINPNGVVFGGGAQINVGSLIATTSNISNSNFMAGTLIFDQPGRPGAGVLNAGTITAREGGLVALVAPHVRNDGVIVARLGRVLLGSADTFTVDLYGDALINLALSDANIGQLRDVNGQPVASLVTNTGRIETGGGQTVLMTARNAKNVLDNLINMSGTVKADTVVQQGGRILLLGEGGKVDVTGTLSAQGATGGSVEVLGDRVHVGSGASIDASGDTAGGTVHVGGAYQGSGDTYRSTETTVDAGATLRASAISQGNGGEVVVWSDGHTVFGGAVEAKGGVTGGNGGRMEVSGKGSLDFQGQADASATVGAAGSLLLDPAYLNIDAADAGSITRVLRTGTSTTLAADVDINVNAAITGGDRTSGGGLTMSAGNNINVNDFVVTNNGAINLEARQGTVTVAPGKAIYAGSAPITVAANGSLSSSALVTGGSLSLTSTAGSIVVDSLIDGHNGPVRIRAAGNVDINQPIVNLVSGDGLTVAAGTDINVNAQVDGRGGVEGGAVSMTANRDLHVNQAVVTNNGAISLTATTGTLQVAADAPIVAGKGAVALKAQGNVTSGPTSGATLAITSSGGGVNVNGLIDSATGDTRIAAASDVNINHSIVNGQTGGSLGVTAGRDVKVNAQVDGRGGPSGGAVTMTAARNVNVNEFIATNNGAITLTATGGTATVAAGKGTLAGSGAVAVNAAGDVTTGAVSGGTFSATSSGGSVRVNGLVDGNTGRVDLNAANDITVNQPVLNGRTGSAFNATAGHDVVVTAQIDGRGGATGGAVTLNAGHDVALNNSIATNNGAVAMTASGGTATMASGTVLASGNGAITVNAASDVTTRGISGGSLSAKSAGGSVNVNGIIDGTTGRVDLSAGRDVNVNQPILNTRTGAALTASAGQGINVNAQIDGTGGAAGGSVTLSARSDIAVNAPVATRNGAISVSSANGVATVAAGAGLYAGTGAISLDALGNVTTGTLNGGTIAVASRGGSVAVSGQISGAGGPMSIAAAGQVDVANAITNPGSGSALTISAGTNINVNAAVGRTAAGVPSGSIALNAGQNVTLNQSVVAENAGISVTAQAGTVTTAAGKGLYAGNGAIAVQSGQTLSTPLTSTTGTVTLRSTAGSVNVDTAIDGQTGAVTLDAATDVNINQGIANPRTDAPLNVTAGRDINVNAKVDGRDTVLTGPSGAVTMVAARNVAVNDDIVGVNTPVSLTATNGTVTWGAGKALFAGTGAISVTAGSDLTSGSTSTTGALTLTSTHGNVNVDTAIGDTTGKVTIAAGTTVNVNQSITNLKSGANLAITAGTDINVAAAVDGRSGAAAGGTLRMTAGNNINLTKAIGTNNGAVNLTASAGSIVLPIGTEVIVSGKIVTPMQAIIESGSAPVSLTSGSDFALTSPVNTTGSLTITSTHGTVTTSAPIADTTGAVTITAGNGLVVNREIRTNNQPISLTAGAGGVTINQIHDYDATLSASVNSGDANMTISSVGNVSILDGRGIATTQTLSIDTRGHIVTGLVGTTGSNTGRPQAIVLNADGGIDFFNAGHAGSVTATSSGGSINLFVDSPDRLRVTTGTPGTLDCPTCDITLTSTTVGRSLGPDVILNAGGSLDLTAGFLTPGTATFIARSGDLKLGFGVMDNGLTGTAGRDVILGDMLWTNGGALTLTAGRDFVSSATTPIHISNGEALTLAANRNLTLFLIETLGAVSLTATTGNITLNNDIGPHIINSTGNPDFNPTDLGVGSLIISAPSPTATITMQGARAQGNVVISTGGTLTAAKEITSVNGTVTITAASATIAAVPIGSQNQLALPGVVSPVVAPGPKAPLPTPPGVVSAGGPGVPVFAEIPVSVADQAVGGVVQPAGASGGVRVAGAAGFAGAAGVSGLAARPGTPAGGGSSQPGASSTPLTDSASALRTAGESCSEGGSSDAQTGLADATATQGPQASADQKNASCPPAQAAGQTSPGAPTAPAAPAAPAPTTGGGLQ